MCYISTNCSAFQEGALLGKPSSVLRHGYLRNRRLHGVDGVEVLHIRSQHALMNVLAVESCGPQQDVIDLFQIGHLPHDQKTQLSSVLLEYQDVFSWYPGDIDRTSKVYHRIPTGDAGPSRHAPRRLPSHKQTAVRDHLEEMLTRGIIQPMGSPDRFGSKERRFDEVLCGLPEAQ